MSEPTISEVIELHKAVTEELNRRHDALISENAKLKAQVERLREAFPFPEITRGNLEAIRFHCKNGKPFGGLTQDALCEWLDGLSIQLQKYIDAKSELETKEE